MPPDGQLALIDAPATVKLTARQSFALRVVQEAGEAYSEEVGAAWHAQNGKHPVTSLCRFCGSSGQEVLSALKRKGLVRERRPRGQPRYWEALAEPEDPSPGADSGSASAQDDGWQRLVAAGY